MVSSRPADCARHRIEIERTAQRGYRADSATELGREGRTAHLSLRYGLTKMPKMVWIVVCAAVGTSAACVGRAQLSGGSKPEGGSQVQSETDPPPTPIAKQKAELGDDHAWDPEWDRIVENALPAELLSDDRERAVRSLCPRFKDANVEERRTFWAYFFQALAGAEAGLEPATTVRHTEPEVAVTDPVTHRIARQEGLLQLAYWDSERYGCEFDWEKDKELAVHDESKTILQPKNNLECGVKILDNQLIAKHQPLLSKSSYWVTLRPRGLSFKVFMKQMVHVPAFCGAPYRQREPVGSGVDAAKSVGLSESTVRSAPTSPSGADNESKSADAAAAAAH